MSQNHEEIFMSAKCRITLKTINSIFYAVRWAVDRNRKFTVFTNDLALGWSIDIDVSDENLEDLYEEFNGKKTEAPIQA